MKLVVFVYTYVCFFFFSSRRRHTRFDCDWSSDVCSSDLELVQHIVIKTDGVPLYVEELTRVLLASSLLQKEMRSEERRVGKSVDLGGRRIIKKKKKKKKNRCK